MVACLVRRSVRHQKRVNEYYVKIIQVLGATTQQPLKDYNGALLGSWLDWQPVAKATTLTQRREEREI